MSAHLKAASRLISMLALFTLTACGGGGSGGSSGSSGASYSLSTNSLNFIATQNGATPAAQQVNISVNSGTVYIGITSSGTGFTTTFQITGPTTGAVIVTPDTPSMSPGTYGGTINVRGCAVADCSTGDVSGSPQVINVSYVISPTPTLTVAPGGISFLVSSGTTPASQGLTLSSNVGSLAWTSSITYNIGAPGWLSLVPASGPTLPATITLNVTSMPAGTYQATLTFSAGAATKSVIITLSVNGPRVNYVSPYVGTTSVGGDVIIRGYGFLGITNPEVKFGATPATAFSVISDTEIRASFPALAQGAYAVTLGNISQTLTTRANLVIVDAPAYAYAALARANMPNGVVGLIYDAERRKLYLLDQDNDRLEAYGFNGTVWALDTPITFGNSFVSNRRMAMTPDGREILKTNYNTISRLDLTAGLARTDVSTVPFLGPTAPSLGHIDLSNDGGAIGNSSSFSTGISLYRFDALTGQFSAHSTSFDFINRQIDATGDRSRLLFAPFGFGALPLFRYDAGDNALSQISLSGEGIGLVSANRTGSKTIITTYLNAFGQTTTVYDASFASLGTLPVFNTAVISPDGAFAYTYVASTGKVHKYNLNSPNGSGGFNEVGTGIVLADAPGGGVRMTISPDGGSLFLAGITRVLIVPAP